MKAVNKVSSAEAVKKVQGQKVRAETVRVQQVVTPNPKTKTNSEVTVEKIILFIV